MKKLITFLMAALMIAATMTGTAFAEFDKPIENEAAAYIVNEIWTHYDYTEKEAGGRLWRWHVDSIPQDDLAADVWLSFFCLTDKPGNGELSVLIRCEDGVYFLRLLLNYYTYTEVFATQNTTLTDDFVMQTVAEKNWTALRTETRGGEETGWIFGTIDPQYWQERVSVPDNLESNIEDVESSEFYRTFVRERIPQFVDVFKFVLWQSPYTLHNLGFCSSPMLCRWHVYGEGELIEPPTATRLGKIRYTCQRCGHGRIVFLPPLGFGDVKPDAYYAEAVDWAVENGITTGTSDDTFSPNGRCTRAQIVTMLWRMAGSPEAEYNGEFSDVKAGSWYAEAVAWAYQTGVTSGTGEGNFSPKAPCTRAQIVTFLWRSAGSPSDGDGQNRFADVPGGAWYEAAVRWAAANGITTGKGGGLFGSDANCTRAEAVTFLWRDAGGGAE